MRRSESGWSAAALAAALVVVAAAGTLGPRPPLARASAPAQRAPTPATTTATPRIRVATRTPRVSPTIPPSAAAPTAIVGETATAPPDDPPTAEGGVMTAVPAETVRAAFTPRPTLPVGTDERDVGGVGATPSDAAAGGRATTALLGPGSPRGPDRASSDGAMDPPGDGAEGGRESPPGRLPGAGPPGAAGGRSTGAADAPGPAGLVRVPVPDSRVRELWADTGSPRRGEGWIERFTGGRPGPWGRAWFYVALLGLYGAAVVGVWRALGRLKPPEGE